MLFTASHPPSVPVLVRRRFWQHPLFVLVLVLSAMMGIPLTMISGMRLNGETLWTYHQHVLDREAVLRTALVQANPVWGRKLVDQRTVVRTGHAATLRTLFTFEGNRFAFVDLDDRLVDVALPLAQWQDAMRLQHAAGQAPVDGGVNTPDVRADLNRRAPGLADQISGWSMAPWCKDCQTVRTRDGDLLGLDRVNGQVWMHLRLDQLDDVLERMPARPTPPDQDGNRVG